MPDALVPPKILFKFFNESCQLDSNDTNAFPGRNEGKKMWKRKQWTNPINMVEFFGGSNTSMAVFQAETSTSRYVRVVKETGLKSVGLRLRRFELCCRWFSLLQMDDFTLVLLWHIHKWCMKKKTAFKSCTWKEYPSWMRIMVTHCQLYHHFLFCS